MEHVQTGTQAANPGPEQFFSGTVHVEMLFDSAETSGGCITFEPCTRSAWHIHPRGQTLVVTVGLGFVQSRDGPVELLRPGDVIWCPPDEKHWHGAAPNSSMTHMKSSTVRLWTGWKRSAMTSIRLPSKRQPQQFQLLKDKGD